MWNMCRGGVMLCCQYWVIRESYTQEYEVNFNEAIDLIQDLSTINGLQSIAVIKVTISNFHWLDFHVYTIRFLPSKASSFRLKLKWMVRSLSIIFHHIWLTEFWPIMSVILWFLNDKISWLIKINCEAAPKPSDV